MGFDSLGQAMVVEVATVATSAWTDPQTEASAEAARLRHRWFLTCLFIGFD
jgi:hypothetical protein